VEVVTPVPPCVTASGVAAFGIGAAFWGLAAGIAVQGLERLRPKVKNS
jgi:benzoate membrane transport protein